jgi:hypothetical protein
MPAFMITLVLMQVPKELIMSALFETLVLIFSIYFPFIHLSRAMYLKMSWREILISVIPIIGQRKQFDMLRDPR